ARPLRRVIQDEIEDRLSESVLRGDFQAESTIKIDFDGEHIVVRDTAEAVTTGKSGKPAKARKSSTPK
ncbi:hypothetical protein ACFLYM_02980, partial [Chloroflexota bacterium]